jgi:hypothetical protein
MSLEPTTELRWHWLISLPTLSTFPYSLKVVSDCTHQISHCARLRRKTMTLLLWVSFLSPRYNCEKKIYISCHKLLYHCMSPPLVEFGGCLFPNKPSVIFTRWFKYDRDKLWLVYTQIVPVIFEPPCTCKCDQKKTLQKTTGLIRTLSTKMYLSRMHFDWNAWLTGHKYPKDFVQLNHCQGQSRSPESPKYL